MKNKLPYDLDTEAAEAFVQAHEDYMKDKDLAKDNEGLEALLGQRVLLLCAGYFYEGKLIEVNKTCVKLDDAAIVYATGKWSDKSYTDIQKLHSKEWYVRKNLIESFGLSKLNE